MTSDSAPETDGGDSSALERSQEAIDEGREAANKALDDPSLASELDTPGTGEGLEEDQEDVTPRPN